MENLIKKLIFNVILLLCVNGREIVSPSQGISLGSAKNDPQTSFAEWASAHGRAYKPGDGEYERRFEIWQSKLTLLAEHNMQIGEEQVGLNGFADWTPEEFEAAYLMKKGGSQTSSNVSMVQAGPYRYENAVFPPLKDWRMDGIFGPIKDQHTFPNFTHSPCGACWAFATIGVTEAINAMYTGEYVALSEQQLIDCDRGAPFYDNGCHAGWVDGGFSYIIENGGVTALENYPWTGWENPKCKKHRENEPVVSIDAYEKIPPYNDTAIMQALAHHPVAIYICCRPNLPLWIAYTGGIWDIECCTGRDNIDHAVVLAGYGETGHFENDVWIPGDKYWLIRNSWGPLLG
eukprot:jgi/Botrbrau1/900/Bobra.0167s0021.1